MKKALQAVLAVLLAPVVLAFAWGFFKRLALALESGRTFWLGIPDGFKWMAVGAAVFALGAALLAGTSLEGLFRPGLAEWFWKKAIRWRPAPGPDDPPRGKKKAEAPPPPAALRVLPYCFPVVLIAAAAVVNAADWLRPFRWHDEALGFVCGFLLAEHLAWVGRDMRDRNPNMGAFGRALTVLVVLWVNIEVLAALTSVILPSFSMVGFNRDSVRLAGGLYEGILHEIRRLWR